MAASIVPAAYKYIGVPREVRPCETRVSLTPSGVSKLVKAHGCTVHVCVGAGRDSGYEDRMYSLAGARLCETNAQVYARSTVVAKVAAPHMRELAHLRGHHVVGSFLNLAHDPILERALRRTRAAFVCYNDVDSIAKDTREISGKVALSHAARHLESGSGMMLSTACMALIIGGGDAALTAAKAAAAHGAQVIVLDSDPATTRSRLPSGVNVQLLNRETLLFYVTVADIIIGDKPRVISRSDITRMKKKAVVMDLSIAQGGLTEVSRPTSLLDPLYEHDGVFFSCVPNIASAVPVDSSIALSRGLLPFLVDLSKVHDLTSSKFYNPNADFRVKN